MPQMTTGALAVCCHLLSSLRCTDATWPQTGLLAKLQVVAVPHRWPTWHCGWKGGVLAQPCGEGKVLWFFGFFLLELGLKVQEIVFFVWT